MNRSALDETCFVLPRVHGFCVQPFVSWLSSLVDVFADPEICSTGLPLQVSGRKCLAGSEVERQREPQTPEQKCLYFRHKEVSFRKVAHLQVIALNFSPLWCGRIFSSGPHPMQTYETAHLNTAR
jgi:hypothetical protein